MRSGVLVLVSVLFLAACGGEAPVLRDATPPALRDCTPASLPTPPFKTEAELRAIRLSSHLPQGLVGHAARRLCDDACRGDCSYEPLGGYTEFVPLERNTFLPAPGRCPLKADPPATFCRTNRFLSMWAGEVGPYAAQLEPGRYMVILEEENGCARCVRENRDPQGPPCEVVVVEPNRILRYDIVVDGTVFPTPP